MRLFNVLVVTLLALPALASTTYQFDPVHSELSFRVKHLGLSKVYGRFVNYKGTIVLDEQDWPSRRWTCPSRRPASTPRTQ